MKGKWGNPIAGMIIIIIGGLLGISSAAFCMMEVGNFENPLTDIIVAVALAIYGIILLLNPIKKYGWGIPMVVFLVAAIGACINKGFKLAAMSIIFAIACAIPLILANRKHQ